MGEGEGAEVSPFGVASIQGSNAKKALESLQESGGSNDAPAPLHASNATQNAMDHKRAFQAVNAETLEVASQDVDYDIPPHKAGVPHFSGWTAHHALPVTKIQGAARDVCWVGREPYCVMLMEKPSVKICKESLWPAFSFEVFRPDNSVIIPLLCQVFSWMRDTSAAILQKQASTQ